VRVWTGTVIKDDGELYQSLNEGVITLMTPYSESVRSATAARVMVPVDIINPLAICRPFVAGCIPPRFQRHE
jgi:hypothetical protein